MSASVQTKQEDQQPIDSLVYGSFATGFNEEYSGKLNENQKELLNNYISSFVDNGLELKVYLNEEVGSLKDRLLRIKNSDKFSQDNSLKEKIEQVYNVLDKTKEKEIDTQTLEIVINTQQLLEEIEKNDN